MSGLHEVDCNGCGRRHVTNGEQARKLRVLRCECGHFVRLDRALAERQSEPAAPPPLAISAHETESLEVEEDEATHMLSSLSAVAAMSGRIRTRSAQPSLLDDERVSRPVPRGGALHSLASTPAPPATRPRQPSIAPSDKPLWYVDLGGTELVQMTIEQLILARRSGKLGEGALVWREGMPSWRPVGTLIPATSASSHPSPLSSPSAAPGPSRSSMPPPPATWTPLPPATRSPVAVPTRTPFPARSPVAQRTPPPPPRFAEDATPKSLGSYERPLATLEFALEKPNAAPFVAPIRSSLPSIDSSPAQPSRLPTPLPRASLASLSGATFPRPAPLPMLGSVPTPYPAERVSPLPKAPVKVAVPSPIPAATSVRESDRPKQQTQASLEPAHDLSEHVLSERPRWVSACIALVVCVTASAAGASLVRNLKQHRRAPALSSQAVPAPVVPAAVAAQSNAPAAAASGAPLVVDVESLTVERKRTVPHAQRSMPKPAPAVSADTSDETTPAANDAAPESSAAEAPKEPGAPAATRSSPYGSGSLIDQIKKATADEEAGQ